ncbi:MAG: hypothetical protein M3P18_02840 [Actinomycetota bacterium]|nr:hypothetical protein [Actinomycetota bacterium]
MKVPFFACVTVSLLLLTGVVDVASASPQVLVTCFGRTATIRGTKGNDVIDGTESRDVIVGKGGDDVIHGLGGDDVICGGGGHDQIFGDDGNDVLSGDGGAGPGGGDVDHGGADDYIVEVGTPFNTLFGDDGNDYLSTVDIAPDTRRHGNELHGGAGNGVDVVLTQVGEADHVNAGGSRHDHCTVDAIDVVHGCP